MSTKLNIFRYQDYRKLVKDLIVERKQNKKVFSYRWFSQKAGLTSPNFLNLVVQGKRHLSSESCESVISIFQLTRDEGTFFRNLVQFNKAKTLSEKERYAQQLIGVKKFQDQFPLSKEQFEYYSKWYHVPVRELLTLRDSPQSANGIARQLTPPIADEEAARAIQQLLDLSMIHKVQKQWKVKQESVTTGHTFSSFGVVQFHKKMLALAAESLDRFPAREREVSAVTIGMSEKTFEKAKVMIEEFRSQLMAMAEADQTKDRLYQINFQLFPLSAKIVQGAGEQTQENQISAGETP